MAITGILKKEGHSATVLFYKCYNERSFSTVRKIKSYLRSTTEQGAIKSFDHSLLRQIGAIGAEF